MKIVLLLFSFIFFAKVDCQSKIWITTCKPCVEVLKSCNNCLTKEEYTKCVASIPNTGCTKCLDDILILGNDIFCDDMADYHNIVCNVNCKVKISLNGYCDRNTNKCTCSKTFFADFDPTNLEHLAQVVNQGTTLIPNSASIKTHFDHFKILFGLIGLNIFLYIF